MGNSQGIRNGETMSITAANTYVDWQTQAWMTDGLCAGRSDLFFAPFAERPEARVRRESKAKGLCESCASTVECKAYARDNRELGFWGAESESERATAGFAPTTPIIGRRQVAAKRAAAALAEAS